MSSQPMTKMDGASKLLVVLVYHASVFGSAPHDLPACRHAPKSNFVFAISSRKDATAMHGSLKKSGESG